MVGACGGAVAIGAISSQSLFFGSTYYLRNAREKVMFLIFHQTDIYLVFASRQFRASGVLLQMTTLARFTLRYLSNRLEKGCNASISYAALCLIFGHYSCSPCRARNRIGIFAISESTPQRRLPSHNNPRTVTAEQKLDSVWSLRRMILCWIPIRLYTFYMQPALDMGLRRSKDRRL